MFKNIPNFQEIYIETFYAGTTHLNWCKYLNKSYNLDKDNWLEGGKVSDNELLYINVGHSNHK